MFVFDKYPLRVLSSVLQQLLKCETLVNSSDSGSFLADEEHQTLPQT